MKGLFGITALLLAFSAGSFAQGVQTGTIRGTVKDQQGLALPGATITAASPSFRASGRSLPTRTAAFCSARCRPEPTR